MNGREHGTNVGALIVRTGDADAPGIDTLPTANTIGVVRARQNVLRESAVGVIATFGDPLRRGNAWLAGPDLTYQPSRFRLESGDRFEFNYVPTGERLSAPFEIGDGEARELLVGALPGIDRRRWEFAANELLVKLQYVFRY